MNRAKSLNLNPAGVFLAFLAMFSWGFYSAIIKKISEWDYPHFFSFFSNPYTHCPRKNRYRKMMELMLQVSG